MVSFSSVFNAIASGASYLWNKTPWGSSSKVVGIEPIFDGSHFAGRFSVYPSAFFCPVATQLGKGQIATTAENPCPACHALQFLQPNSIKNVFISPADSDCHDFYKCKGVTVVFSDEAAFNIAQKMVEEKHTLLAERAVDDDLRREKKSSVTKEEHAQLVKNKKCFVPMACHKFLVRMHAMNFPSHFLRTNDENGKCIEEYLKVQSCFDGATEWTNYSLTLFNSSYRRDLTSKEKEGITKLLERVPDILYPDFSMEGINKERPEPPSLFMVLKKDTIERRFAVPVYAAKVKDDGSNAEGCAEYEYAMPIYSSAIGVHKPRFVGGTVVHESRMGPDFMTPVFKPSFEKGTWSELPFPESRGELADVLVVFVPFSSIVFPDQVDGVVHDHCDVLYSLIHNVSERMVIIPEVRKLISAN